LGAQVHSAYLYSAAVLTYGLYDVDFDGVTLTSNASSRLDVGDRDATTDFSENRWDVTSIVAAKVGGGSGIFDFTIHEHTYLDGEILAVLYSVPTSDVRTAMIFDGELATAGESFAMSLASPYDGSSDIIMSLGISFSCQKYQPQNQYSTVDINGQRLTSSAGGSDDGYEENGGLITAGGIGDSTENPLDPYSHGSGSTYDDELYDIASFLHAGDSLITVDILPGSGAENMFFMGLVTEGESAVVPVPGAALLGTIGLLYSGWRLRRRQT
jgi:hypothetical protein